MALGAQWYILFNVIAGAAALVSLADGRLLWRYDVEPMSYAWYLYADHYLPGETSKQLVKLEGVLATSVMLLDCAKLRDWRRSTPLSVTPPAAMRRRLASGD